MPGEPTEAPIALSGPIDTSHLLQQVGFIQSGKQKRLFPFVTLTERLLRDEDFRARIDRVRYSGFFSGEQYFRPFDVGIDHFDVHRDTGRATSGFGVLTKWQVSPGFEKKPEPPEKVTSYIEALKKPQISLTAAHRRLRDSGRIALSMTTKENVSIPNLMKSAGVGCWEWVTPLRIPWTATTRSFSSCAADARKPTVWKSPPSAGAAVGTRLSTASPCNTPFC
jgi:hypothetical protein